MGTGKPARAEGFVLALSLERPHPRRQPRDGTPHRFDEAALRIEKTQAADHAVLALKGEFDTLYVPSFDQEITGLADGGVARVVLNLRFLRFINSTALGAIV